MSDPYDRDAEDSEYGENRATHHYYGTGSQALAVNGNYNKIILAWASFVTIIAFGVIAFIWNTAAAQIQKNTDALEKLRDTETRMEEQQKRQDERMDFMQREIERLQR